MRGSVRKNFDNDPRLFSEEECPTRRISLIDGVWVRFFVEYHEKTWKRREFLREHDVRAPWLFDRTKGSRLTGSTRKNGYARYEIEDALRTHRLNVHFRRVFLPSHCVLCGITLDYGIGLNEGFVWDVSSNSARRDVSRPSIDRIDNRSGYELGNSMTICQDCNRRKSQFLFLNDDRSVNRSVLRAFPVPVAINEYEAAVTRAQHLPSQIYLR